MNNLTRKVTELEGNVLSSDVKEDTCFISISNLPGPEQELHAHAQQITETVSFSDLTPPERFIVEKSSELLTLRVFLLFRKMIKTFSAIEDTAYSNYFDTRLMWFITESIKLGDQGQAVKKLEAENAGLDEDTLDEKICKLEETFEDTYTEASFDEYENKATLRFMNHVRAKINPADPEQVTTEQLTDYLLKKEPSK